MTDVRKPSCGRSGRCPLEALALLSGDIPAGTKQLAFLDALAKLATAVADAARPPLTACVASALSSSSSASSSSAFACLADALATPLDQLQPGIATAADDAALRQVTQNTWSSREHSPYAPSHPIRLHDSRSTASSPR